MINKLTSGDDDELYLEALTKVCLLFKSHNQLMRYHRTELYNICYTFISNSTGRQPPTNILNKASEVIDILDGVYDDGVDPLDVPIDGPIDSLDDEM